MKFVVTEKVPTKKQINLTELFSQFFFFFA